MLAFLFTAIKNTKVKNMEAVMEKERHIGQIVENVSAIQILNLNKITIGDTLLLSENNGRYFKRFKVDSIDDTSNYFIQFRPRSDKMIISGYEIFENTSIGMIPKGAASTPSVSILKDELSQGILYKEYRIIINY